MQRKGVMKASKAAMNTKDRFMACVIIGEHHMDRMAIKQTP